MKRLVSLSSLTLLLVCVYCTVSIVSTVSGDADQEGSATSDYTSTTTEATPETETHPTTIAQSRPTATTFIADLQTTTEEDQQETSAVQSSGTTEAAVTATTIVSSDRTRPPPSTVQTTTGGSIAPQTESTTSQLDSTTDASAGSVATEELEPIQANATTTQAAPITTEHQLDTAAPTRSTRPTVATTEELASNITTTQTAPLTTDAPVPTSSVATTATEEIASIQADTNTTSAPTEGTTEAPIHPECRVPAYSSINYETTYSNTVTDDSLLIVEGKCYIQCILALSQNRRFGDNVVPNNQFPPWPFSTLKLTCIAHQFVHECTRGCLILNDDVPSSAACRHDCNNHCQNECGALQCDNADSDEWWVRQFCPISCSSSNSCDNGCQISLDCTSTECNRPLNPMAPPTLVRTEGVDRAGVFSVNISESVPSSSSLTTPGVVFLFEVLDHTTSNYSYHWVVDPGVNLDLADFACRDVSVRFAVLSINGLSGFSGPTRIPQVYGDLSTRRPNPVTNIMVVSEEDDTRVGYFGHVIWTISWEHPTSQLHLDGYVVDVYNPNEGSGCGERVWTRRLALNESTSVRVMADEPGDLLVMGCFYTIIVHAIGVDENETMVENHEATIFPSRPEFIDDIQCNKIWDSTEFKFSFNFTWSLPFYIAFENPITEYIISVDTYRPADSNIFVQSLINTVYEPPNLGPNVTDFSYYLPHNERPFFSPRSDSGLLFRFKLYFNFEESKVRFPTRSPLIPNRQFLCTTDTSSPPPSQVQNLTIISYDLLNASMISLNFSWTPPFFPNGVLTSYMACASQTALLGNEEPGQHSGWSVCEQDIEGDVTAAMKEFTFFTEADCYCLNIQIRPRNDYVFGEWSEPTLIYLGAPEPDTNTTTAPTEGTTEAPIHPECRVPAYSSINYETMYNNTVTDDSLLIVEGKCYVECILALSQNRQFGHTVVPNNQFPPWPFSTLKLTCIAHQFVHECTRGCLILNDDVPSSAACRHDCNNHCQNECGAFQCNNPDSDEWWVRQLCPISCSSSNSCDNGCQISLDCTSTGCNRPLNPMAPPTLVRTEGVDRAGVFSVNISGSVPSSSSLTTPGVVFLFEVLDHTTSNYSYHWVVDPGVNLDLADFACREVSVRFAVLSVNGLSGFSEPTRIPQVYGDPTRRPNPVSNIMVVSEEDDTRVGYFGHVIWTISWEHPTSQLHLDGYVVDVYNPNEGNECGERVWTRRLALNESTSVRVMADEPGDLLVMGCFYTIIVHAIGVDENETMVEIHNAAIFPSRPEFIDDIQCNKIWDFTEFKFSFNFTWSLPFYIAFENPITEYIISVDTYRPADSNIFVQSLMSNTVYVPQNLGPNVTDFSYYLPHNERSSFSPRSDSGLFFRFKLYFNFEESKVRFPIRSALVPNRQFLCTTDTSSPPPSQAQNLTIISYDLISTSMISLNFSWTPPFFPNGVLTSYMACVSQTALLGNEEPAPHTGMSFCEQDIEGDVTSAMKEFIFFSYCLNIQIRPRNDYVFGEWSEPTLIYLGAPGSCTDPPPTVTPTTPPITTEITTDPPSMHSPVQSTTNPVIVIGASVGVTVIVVLFGCIVFILFCYCARRRKRNWRLNILHDPSGMDLMFSRDPHRHLLTQTPTDPQLPEIDEWEISASEIIIEDSLGEGAFGEVYKGVVKGPIRCTRVPPSLRNAIAVPVAIKLLKESAQGSERQDFLSEIEMMKTISEGQNPNVIGMVGCVTLQEPLSLILEFVEYGDLLSYLRTNMRMNVGQDVGDHDNPYIRIGSIVTVDLVKFSYQIASGMEYLSSLGVVHRDLACRNILVDEGKVLKITDFGMSREVDEIYIQQSRGRVPLKWMALESILTRQFTSASDVWSYGISLWEIGTMGGFPYPTISNEDLILVLKNGYRMEKPDNCSPEIYAIMLACWDGDPSMRPTFSELKSKFDHMLRSNAEYIYFLPNNSDRPCYQPENAPEGMTLTSPNQIRLSPNANGNRQSTYIQMASTSHSVLPGSSHGRSSGPSSPGPRSPRSISPTSFDPSPSRMNPNVAQRSAGVLLSRDTGKDKRKRTRNLYVDDPSKKAQEILAAQVRPTSMLVSRPSENGEILIGTGGSITYRTSNHSNSRHRRPSSAGESSNSMANGVAGYVNVGLTGNGIENGMEVLNPLFGRELSLDEGNGNEVPAITVTEDCLG